MVRHFALFDSKDDTGVTVSKGQRCVTLDDVATNPLPVAS